MAPPSLPCLPAWPGGQCKAPTWVAPAGPAEPAALPLPCVRRCRRRSCSQSTRQPPQRTALACCRRICGDRCWPASWRSFVASPRRCSWRRRRGANGWWRRFHCMSTCGVTGEVRPRGRQQGRPGGAGFKLCCAVLLCCCAAAAVLLRCCCCAAALLLLLCCAVLCCAVQRRACGKPRCRVLGHLSAARTPPADDPSHTPLHASRLPQQL